MNKDKTVTTGNEALEHVIPIPRPHPDAHLVQMPQLIKPEESLSISFLCHWGRLTSLAGQWCEQVHKRANEIKGRKEQRSTGRLGPMVTVFGLGVLKEHPWE